MPFQNNNKSAGLPPNSPYQIGQSNADTDNVVEQGIRIPWASDPAASYLYYNCVVGVMLDSGIAIHSPLPQVNNAPDSLSAAFLDDPNLEKITDLGVNLKCNDQYRDIVQRMGHARYWFRIWGQAMRVGYKVPIPGIKLIGGVSAVPYDRNPQWAYNAPVPSANFGGIPVWRAEWSLWYTTASPPVAPTIPAADPSAHMTFDKPLPKDIQAPWSQADDNATQASPAILGVARGGSAGS